MASTNEPARLIDSKTVPAVSLTLSSVFVMKTDSTISTPQLCAHAPTGAHDVGFLAVGQFTVPLTLSGASGVSPVTRVRRRHPCPSLGARLAVSARSAVCLSGAGG